MLKYGVNFGGMCPTMCATDADCPGPCGPCLPIFGCTGATGAVPSCDLVDYTSPVVPYDLLPANRMPFTMALEGETPDGGSPIGVGLEGAITIARAVAANDPGTETVVILTADGEPNSCAPMDVAGLEMIAADGLNGSPSVRTHVIQFDEGTPSFDPISAAGGTPPWPRVSETSPSSSQIRTTLEQIRRGERDCKYDVPGPAAGDPLTALTVETVVGGSRTDVPIRSNASECGSSPGFYPEVGVGGPRMILCPVSCDATVDGGATVEVTRSCR